MSGCPAEPNRIASCFLIRSRHHPAVLLVVVATPVEVIDLEAETAVAPGQRLQHFDAGRNHFRADAVAGNGCDRIGLHVGFL
jgi:hypothetical protein